MILRLELPRILNQATRTARAMVTQYGMSDAVGLINYGGDDDEVFIGRDLAHTKAYGENIATVIDQEVKRIVDECHEQATADYSGKQGRS